MAKTSGLGDALLVSGYDISGDIGSIGNISTPIATLDVTGIDKFAHERILGLRDGNISFMSFFNTAVGQEHAVLSTLPRTDVQVHYLRGTTLGNAAACMVAKQINYDPTRGADGSMTFTINATANSYGLDWGLQLTPGVVAQSNSLTGTNSNFETTVGNWVADTNCSIAQTSAQAHGGTGSLAITSTAGGDMLVKHVSSATGGFSVTPGNAYSVQGWVRSAVSARSCTLNITWYTSGGALVSSSTGATVTDSASAWTLAAATDTAPATAAFATVFLTVSATGAGSEVHYLDDVQFVAQTGSVDTTSSQSFGGVAYLQVTAFTGTNVTVKLQDSADNASWADITGMAFTATTAANTYQRLATSSTTATIRRYVRAVTTTAGGYTALSFNVVLNKHTASWVTP